MRYSLLLLSLAFISCDLKGDIGPAGEDGKPGDSAYLNNLILISDEFKLNGDNIFFTHGFIRTLENIPTVYATDNTLSFTIKLDSIFKGSDLSNKNKTIEWNIDPNFSFKDPNAENYSYKHLLSTNDTTTFIAFSKATIDLKNYSEFIGDSTLKVEFRYLRNYSSTRYPSLSHSDSVYSTYTDQDWRKVFNDLSFKIVLDEMPN